MEASKGGGHGGHGGQQASLSVVMVDDLNGNGSPNYGDAITFSVDAPGVDKPSVRLDLYKDGVLVYRHFGWFYGDFEDPSRIFHLTNPSTWPSGPAEGMATLYYVDPSSGKEHDIATLTVSVGA